ncbi:MAG TPA: cytochrome C oxidase subunit IV family protein [Vicinamibacteria bacterium]|nr:cytochrome C oxidase subunit IV family protein [Vicinamibacteria bacterium]
MSEHASSYKSYWILWVVLLTVTVTMIFIGESQISQVPQTLMLLVGSAIKASLIIFFYMHLRFEKAGLMLVVLVGIFVTSILMFAIPAYDGGSNILPHRLFQ